MRDEHAAATKRAGPTGGSGVRQSTRCRPRAVRGAGSGGDGPNSAAISTGCSQKQTSDSQYSTRAAASPEMRAVASPIELPERSRDESRRTLRKARPAKMKQNGL